MVEKKIRTLLDKTYSGESIVDAFGDMPEAIEVDTPVDEHGFAKGTYRVLITFEEDAS